MSEPPGWYPDPQEPDDRLRWWDGETWTAQVTTARPGLAGWVGRHRIVSALTVILVVSGAIGALSGERQDRAMGSDAAAVAEESERVPATESDTASAEDTSAPEERPTGGDRTKPARTESPAKPRSRRYLVVRVIDGDTIELGNGETVRLVGIDTPERGECGYDTATARLRALVGGKRVELGTSDEDRDRYDRLLRYVDVGNLDAGLRLIRSGLAIARYDSRDGYGHHPREGRYIAADRGSRRARCQRSQPAAPPATKAAGSCASGYAPCIPAYPPDLDCAHVDGPIRVKGDDPHGLDRDGDGIACE